MDILLGKWERQMNTKETHTSYAHDLITSIQFFVYFPNINLQFIYFKRAVREN